MRKSLYLVILLLLSFGVTGAGCVSISSTKSVDGGVFRSDDSAESWMQKVFVRVDKKKTITLNNVNPTVMVFHPENKDIIYIGTDSNGIWRTMDRGETWTAFGVSSGNYSTISIDPLTPETVYTATGSSIIKTEDDGANWETIYLEPRSQLIVSVNVDYYDPSRIIAATQDGQIIESIDSGETWTTLNSDSPLKTTIKRLYVNTSDTRIIYAVSLDQGIYKSTDKGSNWTLMTKEAFIDWPGANTINWFTFTEKDPEILYIATNYGIIKSPDSGLTWQPITTLFPFGSVPISTVDVNPDNTDEMYFTIGKVIHKTTDASTTWKTIETFPSGRKITTILMDPAAPEIIYAGTFAPKKK
ncbi:MAG: hypothetical protein WC693_00355 [Patescibacteria group bacterium]|jgi:photosystem II stability/assembly factor-like uncharacterized protein